MFIGKFGDVPAGVGGCPIGTPPPPNRLCCGGGVSCPKLPYQKRKQEEKKTHAAQRTTAPPSPRTSGIQSPQSIGGPTGCHLGPLTQKLDVPLSSCLHTKFWSVLRSTSKVRHSLFDAPCVAQPCVEIFIAGGRYAIILYIIPNKSTSEEGSRRVNIRSLGFLRAKRAEGRSDGFPSTSFPA